MASSAFSFHCMICFEEFDTQTNYPVVLPCGHTYVCVACANRLDKCMECRTPLTMKLEVPTSPQSRDEEAQPRPAPPSALDVQKENQKNRYADRVRNSPGFRRRYGHLEEYSDLGGRNSNKWYPGSSPRIGGNHPQQPPQPVPKVRLPLPKNAVLLSLIQASEPARKRAEVEAPTTPQKSNLDLTSPPRLTKNVASSSSTGPSTLPQFSRPSSLFHHDGSSSGEHHDGGGGMGNNNHPQTPAHHLLGSSSSVDDEEHKIRVGTYLEGGPCGTYAVASRGGLLVYPTLFEHTLPRSLDGLRGDYDADAVTRDVEKVVKNYYKESAAGNMMKTKRGGGVGTDGDSPPAKDRGDFVAWCKSGAAGGGGKSSTTPPRPPSQARGGGSSPRASPLNTTLVESHEDENVEAHCCETSIDTNLEGDGIDLTQGDDDREYSVSDGESEAEGGSCMSDPGPRREKSTFRPMSSPFESCATDRSGGTGPSDDVSPDNKDVADYDVGVSVSFNAADSDDDDDDDDDDGEGGDSLSDIGGGTRALPPRLRPQGAYSRSASDVGACALHEEAKSMKNFDRQFSQGASINNKKKKCHNNDNNNDDFERPLIRLNYGDRVQVVSMDSRGWVKLARGYGYIRLENDKQLVKVGGTSDKACQIEAMLHELSIERNRLKHEQMKLERLSAGLMIDLQSSLLTSDDNVVVSAPAGMIRSESELSISHRRSDSELNLGSSKLPGATPTSLDDIELNARSPDTSPTKQRMEIRTAKSHSPGRSPSLGVLGTPPSPPYGQIGTNLSMTTPTRVNFRTGLSGHRALTSSHSHPHDFIGGGNIRSMSNHAGISTTVKKSDRRGRSIY